MQHYQLRGYYKNLYKLNIFNYIYKLPKQDKQDNLLQLACLPWQAILKASILLVLTSKQASGLAMACLLASLGIELCEGSQIARRCAGSRNCEGLSLGAIFMAMR